MKKLITLSLASLMILCTVGCGTASKTSGNETEVTSEVSVSSAETKADAATVEAVEKANAAIKKADELKNYTLTASQQVSSDTADNAGTSTSKVVYQFDDSDNKQTANVDLTLKSGTAVDVSANLYYKDGYSYATMSDTKVKTKEEYSQFATETLGTVIPFSLTADSVKGVEETDSGYKFTLDSTKVAFIDSYMGNGLDLGDITYEVGIDENGVATKQSYTVESSYTEGESSTEATTEADEKTENTADSKEVSTETTTAEQTDANTMVTTISVDLVITDIDSTKIAEKADLAEYTETNTESMEATTATEAETK